MTFFNRVNRELINFFSKGDVRSTQAKRNIFASFSIKGVSLAVSLILVPLTINYVNPVQYGIWLTLSSIVVWLSFFDIGFGNGLRNKFAEAKATGNTVLARLYISTTYAVLTIAFGLVWFFFLLLNMFIDWSTILNAPKAMSGELSTLALILVSFFCIQIVLKTINTVLIADQKPAKSAFFDMIAQVLSLCIIAVLTKTTQGSLIYLGLTLGSVPILILIFSSLWFYHKDYNAYKPSLKFVDFAYAKDIMKLGMKFFIIQIAVIVVYQTSNIIIAQISGPKDVTIYNIVFKYFGIATMVFSIIISPFWSAFTDAFAVRDYQWMIKAANKLRKIALILIAIVFIMTFFSSVAYKLWMGSVVDIELSISIAMAIYVVTSIWNSLHSLLLNGMGKVQLQLYVSLIATLLNIPIAILLGRKYGIEGVIISAVLLNLISAVYAPIQVSRLLSRTAKGVWNE